MDSFHCGVILKIFWSCLLKREYQSIQKQACIHTYNGRQHATHFAKSIHPGVKSTLASYLVMRHIHMYLHILPAEDRQKFSIAYSIILEFAAI